MTKDELVRYLLTQSNVVVAVEEGEEQLEGIAEWIDGSVEPFFDGERRTMMFAGTIWYLQKKDAA